MWTEDSFLLMPLLSFFLFISIFLQAKAQQTNSIIRPGLSLTPTSKSMWLSPSGLYAFGFYQQSDGFAIGVFLAGLSQKTVVWTANRNDALVSPDATLQFNTDGQLVLQMNQNGGTKYIAGQSASAASMLDSGNFVLYDSNQSIVWQSFDYPTDTILAGQRLMAGKELVSSISDTNHSTGIFRLVMQLDGNLVQYPLQVSGPSYAYWNTRTYTAGNNVTLNLDPDGHLYLLNSTGASINVLNAGNASVTNTIYLLRFDSDGILRLYSHGLDQKQNWSTVWSSSSDKCDPLGLCGLNAYCINNDYQIECKCLPGFDFVSPGHYSLGCQRNFSTNTCRNNSEVTKYTSVMLANTKWEDISYGILWLSRKEDCEKACLEDCNCEAASFKDGECKKLRLPLRFGRRLLDDSTIVFLKVGSSTIPSPTDRITPRKRNSDNLMAIIAVGVSISSAALIVLATLGVLIYRKRFQPYKKHSENGEVGLTEVVGLRVFTFEELVRATNNFKEELGKGSFGTVYKGIISNPKITCAVKKLDNVLEESEREFQTEMKVIGRTYHRNLVKLYGYCSEGPNRLLVFEYMSQGSLTDIIFIPEKKPCWDERVGFVLDIARGILYLHEECEVQIIHCDIKPQNILLDDCGSAKISDFGVAKLMRVDQTKTYTGVRGTRGYVAPEWFRKLPVTVKADVYSFGVLLFEIICCRKNMDSRLPDDQVVLEQWVYDNFEVGKLQNLVGDEVVDISTLERMVKVGIWCIQDEPSLRPSMKKILLMLEGTVDIPIPPSPTSFLSIV